MNELLLLCDAIVWIWYRYVMSCVNCFLFSQGKMVCWKNKTIISLKVNDAEKIMNIGCKNEARIVS